METWNARDGFMEYKYSVTMSPYNIPISIDTGVNASTLPLYSLLIRSSMYVCQAGKLIVLDMALLITDIFAPFLPICVNENIGRE